MPSGGHFPKRFERGQASWLKHHRIGVGLARDPSEQLITFARIVGRQLARRYKMRLKGLLQYQQAR